VNPGLRRTLGLWIVLIALGALVGVAYNAAIGARVHISATIGAVIAGSITGFELFVVQGRYGAPLRRLPLALFIASTTVAWLAFIWAALEYVPMLFPDSNRIADYTGASLARDMTFSFVASFVFNTAPRIRMLVGPRVLANFLLGRYHRPLREERVFMFLDLVGSTRLAEQYGDMQVQNLIAQFFFDIAGPIADSGGETHRYIGDEVVVTWPLDVASRDARCVRCALAIRDRVAARADSYRQRFGTVPAFRIGMHGGAVVASEVGDDRREIVYFGDTVNTAARLESLCKELGRDFLVSGPLLARLDLPPGTMAEPLGPIALKGKAAPIEVFAIAAAPPR
jgi:adenylate cyclase